jgi:hypothetical protein
MASLGKTVQRELTKANASASTWHYTGFTMHLMKPETNAFALLWPFPWLQAGLY